MLSKNAIQVFDSMSQYVHVQYMEFHIPEYHESDITVGILTINTTEGISENLVKSWSHTANTSSDLTGTLLPLSAVATGHPGLLAGSDHQ